MDGRVSLLEKIYRIDPNAVEEAMVYNSLIEAYTRVEIGPCSMKGGFYQ